MKPKICKGTKNDFYLYVRMALQDRMPWKTLAMLLNDVAPTLTETREIISILLKELETLHSAFQNNIELLKKYEEESETLIDSERVNNEAREVAENQEEMLFDVNEDYQSSKEREEIKIGYVEIEEDVSQETNDTHHDKMQEIDNEWYTFISNDKQEDIKAEKSLEGIKVNLLNKEDDSEQNDNENSLQCEICYRSFYDVSNLRQHKRIHAGAKPYECSTCNKRFRQSCSLKKHERIHTGEVPYECLHCSKNFMSSSELHAHKIVHSDLTPFECKDCGKKFKSRNLLRGHMKTHKRQ